MSCPPLTDTQKFSDFDAWMTDACYEDEDKTWSATARLHSTTQTNCTVFGTNALLDIYAYHQVSPGIGALNITDPNKPWSNVEWLVDAGLADWVASPCVLPSVGLYAIQKWGDPVKLRNGHFAFLLVRGPRDYVVVDASKSQNGVAWRETDKHPTEWFGTDNIKWVRLKHPSEVK